jgi:hypothetical protein
MRPAGTNTRGRQTRTVTDLFLTLRQPDGFVCRWCAWCAIVRDQRGVTSGKSLAPLRCKHSRAEQEPVNVDSTTVGPLPLVQTRLARLIVHRVKATAYRICSVYHRRGVLGREQCQPGSAAVRVALFQCAGRHEYMGQAALWCDAYAENTRMQRPWLRPGVLPAARRGHVGSIWPML